MRQEPTRTRRWMRRFVFLLGLYLVVSYGLLPLVWRHYEHQKKLADVPMLTHTPDGIPGDPVNVGLVGDEAEMLKAMNRAGWSPADPVTLESSIRIVAGIVLDRRYADAPVSPLLLLGRKQDLAFEKAIGTSPDRRNHVRFWKVLEQGDEGRPVWLGAATQDSGVGVSHYTGEFTHAIAPNIDDERNLLMADLAAAKIVMAFYNVTGIGPTVLAWNGGGDRYFTDGEVKIAVIARDAAPQEEAPVTYDSPPWIAAKDSLWAQAVAAAGD
ncbi:LssY C-terminal domain-containing protein [Aestuariivirga sp.]|uniref:LssY C-terminal domain-containing protein n=1 Tax=Aestuariivirga sp. TaxID=2650926 RepID=UPI0039E32475